MLIYGAGAPPMTHRVNASCDLRVSYELIVFGNFSSFAFVVAVSVAEGVIS